jgi:hypothetical protein
MIRLVLLSLVCLGLGCRSTEKTSYSVETTSRTAVNPYDCRLVDKIDITVTLRKQW